jgi:Putative Ig domain
MLRASASFLTLPFPSVDDDGCFIEGSTMSPTTSIRRWAIHGGITVFAALTLAAGMQAAAVAQDATTPTSGAVSNPYSPAYHHHYRYGVVPTRGQYTKMRNWAAAHPNVPAASANDLNYGGGRDGIGVTTGQEKVYLVFWGSQWGTQGSDGSGNATFSGDPSGAAPYVQKFIKGLGTNGELWSGVMTQYCDGVATGAQTCPASNTQHVAYPTSTAFAGLWADESAPAPSAASAAQIGTEAVNAAAHFGNTTAASNRNAQYVIFSPHGANPDNYRTGGFCAWHDYNVDLGVSSSFGDIALTNLPYLLDVGTSCGQNFVNGGSAGTLDGFSIVEGHEYAETITDQNPPGGWTDSGGAENGDKCAWITPGTAGGSFDLSMSTGSFAVQTTWGNDGNAGAGTCQASHSIVTNGGGGNTVTVNNPGNKTGTVGTATSLQMTATDSQSGQTFTWSATGLPAGLSINSSTGLISGTPTTANTYNVTVTATDTTGAHGSASFTWTISSGGGCTPQQLLGNPGFETGSAAPWTSTAGVINPNGAGETAHSGSWYAWLDGYGFTHTDTLSQTVTIPSGCAGTFSFYLHIDTAETTTTTKYDNLTITANGTTLATFSNLNHASGYQFHSYPLTGLTGSVTVKFSGTEDVSLQTSFVVDDTAVNTS